MIIFGVRLFEIERRYNNVRETRLGYLIVHCANLDRAKASVVMVGRVLALDAYVIPGRHNTCSGRLSVMWLQHRLSNEFFSSKSNEIEMRVFSD